MICHPDQGEERRAPSFRPTLRKSEPAARQQPLPNGRSVLPTRGDSPRPDYFRI